MHGQRVQELFIFLSLVLNRECVLLLPTAKIMAQEFKGRENRFFFLETMGFCLYRMLKKKNQTFLNNLVAHPTAEKRQMLE